MDPCVCLPSRCAALRPGTATSTRGKAVVPAPFHGRRPAGDAFLADLPPRDMRADPAAARELQRRLHVLLGQGCQRWVIVLGCREGQRDDVELSAWHLCRV